MNIGTIIPKLFKKAHARKLRKQKTTFVTGNTGNYKFHDKPQYKGHKPSSHLMADDGVSQAWPSIYKDENDNWSNQTQAQAEKRNELYTFHGKNAKKRMINFARAGNWKKQN